MFFTLHPTIRGVRMQKKSPMIVRSAEEEKDYATLAHVMSECFGPVTPRNMKRWIQNEKKNASGYDRFFVAEVDGKAVGNVSAAPRKLHLGEEVYVKTLGVLAVCTSSEYRNRGVATSLLKQAMAFADKSGFSNTSLYTATLLPAHRIYERQGFRDVEKTTRYVKHLDYDFFFRRWVMWCNRYLKYSNIAQKTLQGWNHSVVFDLGSIGVKAFRFRNGRFQRLTKPPQAADIHIVASAETLTRLMSEVCFLGDAIKTGEVQVKRGSDSDLKILNKILVGIWDE
jgi:predicted N-acetyltransferase YhbS